GGAGGLRHPARCQQYLRFFAEPQLQSPGLPEQRPCGAGGANPYRRPFQVRKVHPRHPRSSGAGSGVGAVYQGDRAGRPYCPPVGVGRPYSILRRGPRRGLEGQALCARPNRGGIMNLDELQRAVFEVIRQPLTDSEGMREQTLDGRPVKGIVDGIVKPNDRLTSFERLEIYNRVYWFRILSALAEDFPGLRAVIGQTRFD